MSDHTVWLTLAVAGYLAMVVLADNRVRVRSSPLDVAMVLPAIFAAGILDVMLAQGEEAWWQDGSVTAFTFVGLILLTAYGYRHENPFGYAGIATALQAGGIAGAGVLGERIDPGSSVVIGDLVLPALGIAALLAGAGGVWAAVSWARARPLIR